MEFRIFEAIKEAFETSTSSNNLFRKVIKSIKWDSEFFADGEFYFVKGGFCFTTPSVDPFKICKNWRPSAIFSDGSCIEI